MKIELNLPDTLLLKLLNEASVSGMSFEKHIEEILTTYSAERAIARPLIDILAEARQQSKAIAKTMVEYLPHNINDDQVRTTEELHYMVFGSTKVWSDLYTSVRKLLGRDLRKAFDVHARAAKVGAPIFVTEGRTIQNAVLYRRTSKVEKELK